MDLFITGNLKSVGKVFFKNIVGKYKFVISGKNMLKNYNGVAVNIFDYDVNKDSLSHLFQSYDFQSVIFFSLVLDGEMHIFDEFDRLEKTIQNCKDNNVKNLIYITSNEFQEAEHQNNQKNSRYIFMNACEELCYNAIDKSDMNIVIIRIPYLYSNEREDNLLGQWIQSAAETGIVTFPGIPDHEVDFLSEEDLAKLVSRILDEPYRGFLELNISGGNRINFQTLGEVIADTRENIQIKYEDQKLAIPQYHKSEKARELYGWYPLSDLQFDVYNMVKNENPGKIKKKKIRAISKLSDYIKEKLIIAIEMAFLFTVVTLIDRSFSNSMQSQFMDLRMLFVIIMGTIYGFGAGIVAAVLAGVGYYFSQNSIQQWQLVFYNVSNWLPYGSYFLIGSVVGYSSNKKRDEMKFLQEEQVILEDKYVFLNELYSKTLESKSIIHNQVLNYKNSYGRIYSVVQKLESTLPDSIFFEAINALEDILDNRFISIYSVFDHSDFARLVVCSKSMSLVLNKSMKLSDYPEMMTTLREENTWINVECHSNYPAYATAIFKEKKMIGIVFVMQVLDRQMSLDFTNKLNIITGLIKGSLVRAIQRMELVEKDTMIPDTKILNKKTFAQVLEVKRKMKEKEFSEYLLLKIKNTMSFQMLSDTLSKVIRSNDVMGQGEDEAIYLLLSQIDKNNFSAIAKRLENSGVKFELLSYE
ncbi:MAG: hypothetical protein PHG19_04865 [Anaerotignum sp.]|nr:hypothetical protein [Anaerotignum sp.]